MSSSAQNWATLWPACANLASRSIQTCRLAACERTVIGEGSLSSDKHKAPTLPPAPKLVGLYGYIAP